MFTGIVEEKGRVRKVDARAGGARIEIEARRVLEDASVGDSIAVNGCCLTVVELGEGWWAADAQVETVDRTTLASLQVGDPVNLERPLRLSDRLGGHLVSGHIDGTGTVTDRVTLDDGSVRMAVDAPPEVLVHVVEKGSVTVDGVSLTVASVDDTTFEVALIPHTLEVTNLGTVATASRVNLEADMIAKLVDNRLAPYLEQRPVDHAGTPPIPGNGAPQ